MSLSDIAALPVERIAHKDCVLFMWCTDPLLNKQVGIIESWGFNYKTVGFYWVKENKNKNNSRYWKGTGYWTRANPETCLLATKGKPKRMDGNVDKLVFAERGRHSKKPHIVRERIVQLCGDKPRIELFARDRALGWDAWGNEV